MRDLTRSARTRFAAALLVLGLFLPAQALAAPQDEARRHFNAGLELVRQGDFMSGVDEFLKAYEIQPHPSVLYNIARACADAKEYEKATSYFEQYLASDPPDRVEVEGILSALQRRMEAEAAAAAQASQTPPPQTVNLPLAGGIRSDEVAAILQHAEELATLARALQERAPVEAPVIQPETPPEVPAVAEPPTETVPAEPLVVSEPMVEDLYARVVVTASRYQQDPLTAPSAITVISSDDIRMSPANSVADLLRMVPGMDVMQLAASQSEVGIRGFNDRLSNKVLVLVDGRSVYMDFIGSTLWDLLPVRIEEIERIEIVRGTGSAIYGANAFSGVVNIITRAPGDAASKNQVTLDAGVPDLQQGSLVLSGREGRYTWRASAGGTHLSRYAQEMDLSRRPDYASPLDDQGTAESVQTANAQLDMRIGDKGLASVSTGLAQGLLEFYAIGTLGDFYSDARYSYLRGDLALGDYHLRSFWNGFHGWSGSWYPRTGGRDIAGNVDSDVVDVELGGDWKLGAKGRHHLSAALGYRRKQIDWGFLDAPHEEDHFNGYVQDESAFGPVSVTASMRVDAHPIVGVTPSPRLAVVTQMAKGRALRVSGGTAFRNPTFMESYLALDQSVGSDGIFVQTQGNTSLLPEQIVSLEAAWLEQSSDWWRGELVGSFNRVNQLISLGEIVPIATTDPYDPGASAYLVGTTQFVNEEPVYRTFTGEASVTWFGFEGLDVQANYALVHMVTDDGTVVRTLHATPTHKVNAGVTWRSPWHFDTSMFANWVSAQTWPIRSFDSTGQVLITEMPLDGWFLLSNRVVVRPLQEDSLELALDAWNWLAFVQEPHQEHPLGQPVDGRLQASVTARF